MGEKKLCYIIEFDNPVLVGLSLSDAKDKEEDWWCNHADEALDFEEFVSCYYEGYLSRNSIYKIF